MPSDADAATTLLVGADPGTVGPWYVQTRATGLSIPFDIAVDPATGDAYVAERGSHRISKITPAGVRTTFAGSGTAGFADGSATAAKFNNPMGIARDDAGNLYVGDEGNNRIRKIAPDGTVSTLAGTATAGFVDGPAATAQFSGPNGVAVDSAGIVYIVEKLGHRVRKYDPATGNVTLVAGSTTGATGLVDAVGSAARFYNPANCQVTADGATLYVADQSNDAIRNVELATNTVSTYATVTGPCGVEINPANGHVYAACFVARRVYEIPYQGLAVSIAGTGVAGNIDNTYGDQAQFQRPVGLGITSDGALLVADYDAGRVRVLTQPTLISDDMTATGFVDDQIDPYGTWPDYGAFTDSAAITFRGYSSADTGKFADAASVGYRAITVADTGTFTEATRFDDPASGPTMVRYTGQEEHGTYTATSPGAAGAANNFATVTVKPGELLLVSLYAWSSGTSNNTTIFTTLTGLGMTFTRASFGSVAGSGGMYRLVTFWGHYYGDAPLTGPLTASGGGASGVYSVAHIIGHDPNDPIAQASAPNTYTLNNTPVVGGRAFAVVGNGNANVPVPRANWTQVSVGVSSGANGGLYMAVGTQWRPDMFEATATPVSNYNYGYAFEIQPPGYPVTDTDTGAFTEDQSDPVVSWADTGTFTEDASVRMPKSGADTGTVTEAAIVALAKYTWDAGVVDEAAILQDLTLIDRDYVTATEDTSVQVESGGADTGKVTDAAKVNADLSDADSGVFVDGVVSAVEPAEPVGDADTVMLVGEDATLDEVQRAVAGNDDLGVFVEDASAAVVDIGDQDRAGVDSGAFTETVPLIGLTAADVGVLTDTQTDPVDVSYQDRDSADTATVTDAAIVGRSTDTDTATVTETASVLTYDPVADGDTAALTDEAVGVGIKTADTGSVTDLASGPIETMRITSDIDNGRVRDRLSLLIKDDPQGNSDLTADDYGALTEAESWLTVELAADDTGVFGEDADAVLASRDLTDDEQVTFTEDEVVAEVRSSGDTGVFDEAVIVRLVYYASDDVGAFTDGGEVVSATVPAGDLAAGTDKATGVQVDTTGDDTAAVTDEVTYLGVPVTPVTAVSETFTVTEQATYSVFSHVLTDADTGRVTDTAALAVADAYWTLDDTATFDDDAQPIDATLTADDRGVFAENLTAFSGSDRLLVAEDTATATDAGTPTVGIRAETDTAVVNDSEYLYPVDPASPQTGVWDRGTFDDTAVSVGLFAVDAASVSDEAGDLFEVSRDFTATDSGRWRDRLDVLMTASLSGSLNSLLSDDQGTFTEDTLDLPGDNSETDNGSVSDDAQLLADIIEGDTAAFIPETGDLLAAPHGDDPARFVIEDARVAELTSPTVGQTSDDRATFTDTPAPVIALFDGDAGLLTDSPAAVVGLLGADSATVTDGALLVGLSGGDTASLADARVPVIAVGDGDSGTLDDPAPQTAITADDTGALADADALHATGGTGDTGAFDEENGESTALVPAADDVTTDDAARLFADLTEADSGGIADAAGQQLAAAHDTEAPTVTEAEDLHATAGDTDTARFTEAALLYTETGIGAFTGDDGRLAEGQALSVQLPADDTSVLTDAGQLLAGITDAEIGRLADGQALTVNQLTGDTGRLTEAALLYTETGIGVFTGEDGRFTEPATLVTWEAFVYPQDGEAVTVTETQSVHRADPDAPWIEIHPGSMLKVNVATRRVYLSDYFTSDEYPVGRPLPEAARFKLDAFGAILTPNARPGDELEDADFRYHYQARWVTPNRRETGWYIVAWRRPSGGPDDWLA